MWQVDPRISWLTQGITTLSWPLSSEPSPPKPVAFWVLQEKELLKDSPKHFFVAGMDTFSQLVSGGPWAPYSLTGRDVLTKLGTIVVMGSFQPLEPYRFCLLLRNPLHPLQQRGTKNYGRTKLTPRCGTRGRLVETTKLNQPSLSSWFPNWKQYPSQKRSLGKTTASNK